MSWHLVPAEPAHVPFLAHHLRPIDRFECLAMGRSPAAALEHGLSASAFCCTAMIGTEPHAMFGLVVDSVLASRGIPWFLGTGQVRHHGRALVGHGPAIIARMHDHAQHLVNFVSSDNRPAIALLERWGFNVEQEHITMRGAAFRRFTREIA